ncbi:hypothetical protein ID866_5265 [Astraeus odoratus]|nr:hypothetical protein ID866_5265 [Astraeus odoratus]
MGLQGQHIKAVRFY